MRMTPVIKCADPGGFVVWLRPWARELREVVGDRVRQERYVDELLELLHRYK